MPLRIRVLSDLHLESTPFAYRDAGEDLVVLAGDIADGTDVAQERCAALMHDMRGKSVLYVLGNHEFHHRYEPVGAVVETIRAGLPSHVRLLHRESVEFGGVMVLGCPLWTDFSMTDGVRRRGIQVDSECAMHAAAMSVADFAYMTDSRSEPIGPRGMAAMHQADRAWLSNRIRHALQPTMVVTHWLPSPGSVSPRHVGNILNPYFANDCRDLMRDPVRVWIHGHTHDACDYVHEQRVRVVCNPRGSAHPDGGFRDDLVVEMR